MTCHLFSTKPLLCGVVCTYAGLFLIVPLRINLSEIEIGKPNKFHQEYQFQNVHWKIAFNLSWHQCLKDYHIEAETRWPPFSRLHFQMHFLQQKLINFD